MRHQYARCHAPLAALSSINRFRCSRDRSRLHLLELTLPWWHGPVMAPSFNQRSCTCGIFVLHLMLLIRVNVRPEVGACQ